MPTLPVFMYHHVAPNKGDMITVMPEVFEAQMRLVRDNGYRTLSLDEVYDFVKGGIKPKGKCVAVTFDDGYLDNYKHAFPVLKKYGIKAAIFLVTDWVDKATEIAKNKDAPTAPSPTHKDAKMLIKRGEYDKAVITWPMAREMSAETGGAVEFYSHTATHCNCDAVAFNALAHNLRSSKETIERELVRPCPYLCWPKGRFNQSSVEIAANAGFKALFTTRHGVTRPGADALAIQRIPVKDGANWFKTRLMIYTNPLLAALYARIKR